MYLLRVAVIVDPEALLEPNAKIPLVEFPAAEPHPLLPLETATPQAVEVQEEYVYLLRVVLSQPQFFTPKAKIPLVEFPAAVPA